MMISKVSYNLNGDSDAGKGSLPERLEAFLKQDHLHPFRESMKVESTKDHVWKKAFSSARFLSCRIGVK